MQSLSWRMEKEEEKNTIFGSLESMQLSDLVLSVFMLTFILEVQS